MHTVLDLLGIFVFAVSGALVGVRRRFDIVGIAVLAEITALGGGVLRDVFIGALPPVAFRHVGYSVVPLLAVGIVLFWHPHLTRIRRTILFFDAAGLGMFSVVGTEKALEYGLAPFPAALLGVCTAIGGGILRDVLAQEIPNVLRRDSEIYAIAACLGAGLIAIVDALGWDIPGMSVVASALAFGLRLLALRYGWRAPHARDIG
ncbi:MAG: trimeric intracellular cation channel family protein [Actinomadura sp.]